MYVAGAADTRRRTLFREQRWREGKSGQNNQMPSQFKHVRMAAQIGLALRVQTALLKTQRDVSMEF
jgi:hypothetical protein